MIEVTFALLWAFAMTSISQIQPIGAYSAIARRFCNEGASGKLRRRMYSIADLRARASDDDIDDLPGNNDAIARLLQDGLRRTSLATDASTSDEIFQSTPSLQRLRAQIQQLTRVATSSLGDHAGLGLFAAKNVKAGSIVGLYPAHALGYEDASQRSLFVTSADNSEEDRAYFQQNPHGNSPYLHATDQPLFRRPSLISSFFTTPAEAPPIYLDVNPNNNDKLDAAWTSHYINDGASLLDAAHGTTLTDSDIEQYYIHSTNMKNCIHIPFGPSPILATVTTKKVKKGQEFFTSYGAVYWLGSLQSAHVEGAQSLTMTNDIQRRIQESAMDLHRAMEGAKRVYAVEAQDLETTFRTI